MRGGMWCLANEPDGADPANDPYWNHPDGADVERDAESWCGGGGTGAPEPLPRGTVPY